MTERSGPIKVLQAATTHALVDTYYDATNTITMGTRANSLRLYVTSAVSSPGDVTFRLTVNNPSNSDMGAAVFYDYCTEGEAPETFGPLNFTGADQTKLIILRGLDLLPLDVVQVSYAATANAAGATVAIVGESFHSDMGGGSLSVEEIEVDLAALEVLLADVPNVIGTDGAAGPTKAVSVAGTNSADGKLQELHVDGDGDAQVDVLTLPGGLTGFAEDIAHTTADVGVEVLAVRNDALASLCSDDGDYAPIQVDASGSVYTRDSLGNAILTTIDADTGAIKTAVETLDNIVYAEDVAHTTADPGAQVLAVRNDTLASLCSDDGDYTPLQVDAYGALFTNIAKQDLTAVKISADAAANAADNPIFTELTDGAAAIATTNPLSVNLTDGTSASLISDANTARAVTDHVLSTQEIGADGTVAPTGSLLTNAPFSKITDGTTNVAVIAGTTALKTDTSSIAGTATSVNTGAVGAGVQRITVANDDVISTATGIHDVAAAAKLGGQRLLGNATAALQTAVSAAGDDAKINTDLSGQVRLASHVIANVADNVTEIDPISEHYSPVTILVSDEAVAADPGVSYAPDSDGHALTYGHQAAIQLYINGGVGAVAADRTVTVTIEATMGLLVAAAVRWIDVSKLVLDLNTGLSQTESWTSTGDDPQEYLLSLGSVPFSHFRVKYDWDADPSVTNGAVVVNTYKSAL